MMTTMTASTVTYVATLTDMQRELLNVMRRNRGRWPVRLRLCVSEQRAMDALVRRELVAYRFGVYRLVTA